MRKKSGHGVLFYGSKPAKPTQYGSELLVYARYRQMTVSHVFSHIRGMSQKVALEPERGTSFLHGQNCLSANHFMQVVDRISKNREFFECFSKL